MYMTNPKYIVALVSMIFLCTALDAQDLINTGAITNTGLIAVYGHVGGLPPAIGGTFGYFGADQNIDTANYSSLVLSGTGSKTISGNLTIATLLTINTDVTLRIDTPAVVTIEGILVEAGMLTGSVKYAENFSDTSMTSYFGQIGLTVIRSAVAPGITSVERTSGAPITMSNGNHTIARYFDIKAEHDGSLDATLIFHYVSSDLGLNDPDRLQLWHSLDRGATWKKEGGVVVIADSAVVKNHVDRLSGRWTLIDSTLEPSSVDNGNSVASLFTLDQNYPNPARERTAIRFTLPSPAHVTLTVSDITGREVARLADGVLSAGAYEKEISVGDFTSGVYRYTLTAGTTTISRMMTVKK